MEAADKFFEAREQRDYLKQELKLAQEKLDAAEKELVSFMDSNGLQNFKDATRGMVYLREQLYVRLDDESKAFTWLRENGYADIIKETVNNKTLTSVSKEVLEKDAIAIPGVESTFETKIGFRKGGVE